MGIIPSHGFLTPASFHLGPWSNNHNISRNDR